MKKHLLSIFYVRTGELEPLNGLRAISILGVFILHAWIFAGFANLTRPDLLDRIIGNFTSFVNLFFILSGFLIYKGLAAKFVETGSMNFIQYFINRSLRIFPAYFFFLFINILVIQTQLKVLEAKPVLSLHETSMLESAKERSQNWVYDAFYVSDYFPGNITHGWSLSIEEQFYLLLPLIIPFLFQSKRNIRISILALLYAIPLAFRIYHTFNFLGIPEDRFIPDLIYRSLHTILDAIILGILIFELMTNFPLWNTLLERKYSKSILICISVVFLTLAHISSESGSAIFFLTLRFNFIDIGFGILLFISLHENSMIHSFLKGKIFVPIARLSYGIYLWHIAISGAIMGHYIRKEQFQNWQSFILISLLSFAITFVVVWLIYLLIEYPFLSLKKNLQFKGLYLNPNIEDRTFRERKF
ncbi:MAG: acyltransferase [Leptospira sp.]|nr:acyltransferase [Leptospira sp.]